MEEIFFLYVSCETGEETALQVVEFRRVIFEDNFLYVLIFTVGNSKYG